MLLLAAQRFLNVSQYLFPRSIYRINNYLITEPPIPRSPCSPSPCAENSLCTEQNGLARCTCIPPYIGNPYAGGCRPECIINSDCPSNLACITQHCRNPCQGLCGTNAECTVVNHVPVCTCLQNYEGDPFTSCRLEPVIGKDIGVIIV